MLLNRKDLSAAANAVGRFTNARSPKPAMQCIQLHSEGSELRIRGLGTYGFASVAMPCEGKISAMVQAASFCKTVDLMSGDDVQLKVSSNKLHIQCGPSKMHLPVYDLSLDPCGGQAGAAVLAKAADVIRCLDIASTVCSNTEVSYANGVRICSSTRKLHFSASTSKNSGFSWCDFSGGDIDVVVASGSIAALSKILSMMNEVTIMDRTSHVAFISEGRTAVVLKESTGRPPGRYDRISSMWSDAHRWKVSRDDLLEFIKQAMAVSTPEATGVWLKPKPSGLLCEYTGVSDGTYAADLSVEATCETYVQGESCSGMDAYVSCRVLAPAVAAMCSEEFLIYAVDERALVLESKDGVIGLGQLTHPRKQEEVCN